MTNQSFLRVFCFFSIGAFFIFPFIPRAQVFINPALSYLPPSYQDPLMIKGKNIQSIVIDLAYKPDNEIITDRDQIRYFEFDTLGKLTKYYYTKVIGLKKKEDLNKKGITSTPGNKNQYLYDTLSTDFYYDKKNQLTISRSKDGDYYNTWYYEYDELGRLIIQKNIRETSVSENKTIFKLGIQNVVSTESYKYNPLTDKQTKIICLNDEGRPYKEIIVNKDTLGRITEQNEESVVSWIWVSQTYKYNEDGRITEKTYSSNASGEFKEMSSFEYDTEGKLQSEKRINNGITTNEHSYLYNSSGLLTSRLDRDFINKGIGIEKIFFKHF